MKIHKYKNYDDYVKWQIHTNKEKKGWVYVKESTIQQIVASHLSQKMMAPMVICHGTRAGAEQKFFKKYLPNAEVLGTEISDNATEYPMTIQHDFNFQKDEWIGKYDIVYSNCIDHSIDPKATLKTWSDQLSPVGRMYVEYCQNQSIPGGNVNDPLDATDEEIEQMIKDIGMVIVGKITRDVKGGGLVFICEKGK